MRPVVVPPTDEGVIVAFSGGKDSLAVLDLALKHCSRVEAFFMYALPDLEYNRVVIDYAEQRFGIRVRQYPHWHMSLTYRDGLFCDAEPKLRELGMQDVIRKARADTGLHWCGLGYRIQESRLQRRWLSRKGWHGELHEDGRWAPLRHWSRRELLAYLRRERIVIPGISAGSHFRPSGIDLSRDNLALLRATFPNDYARVIAAFPWACAQVDRKADMDARYKSAAQKRREYDKQRGSAASRGYGHAWRRLRDQVLADEPWCRECAAKKLRTVAKHIDHIIPKREFESGRVAGDPNARTNLQPLCHECHSRKTALEDSAFAGPRLVTSV